MIKSIFFITVIFGSIQNISAQEFPRTNYFDSIFLLDALNTYHTGSKKYVPKGIINSTVNLTPQIKQKLLSLLKREWSDSEIKIIVDSVFKQEFEFENMGYILGKTNKTLSLERSVYDSVYKSVYAIQYQIYKKKYTAKGEAESMASYLARKEAMKISLQYKDSYDSVYRHTYDSMAYAFRKEKENELKETPVPDEIVVGVGDGRIYEAVPILKNDIASSKHYFNKDAIITALAALGDSMYVRKVFERHAEYVQRPVWQGYEMFDDFRALLSIRTQESFALVADWIDTSKTYLSFSEVEDDPGRTIMYVSSSIIPAILTCLKNPDFFEGYKKFNPPNSYINYYADYLVTKEHLVYVKNWLIANKGRYEFW